MGAARTVVFDARWMTPVPSGITVYSRELMRRLPALEPSWRWHFLFRDEAQRDTALAACGFAPSLRVATHLLPCGPLSPRSQRATPRLLRSLNCDLFHSPNYMVPFLAFGGARTLLGAAPPSNRGCGRCIATIHDAIPLILRDYAPRSATSRMLWLYRACLRFAIRSSAFTITGSEASRRDIAAALSLDERAAAGFRTIHDGVSDRFSPGDANGVEALRPGVAKVVLYVGRLDPYKNVPELVDAFAMLLRESGSPLHLLIVGPEDRRYPEARLHAQY
ncbi:MAG: glycosyltransferase, partial [Kiritimatiellae bacterium]|nr:glycosyltransferase [Kiritimatiellia bacterium]